MKSIYCAILVAVACAGLLSHASAATPGTPNWPQFRGPNSQGVAEDAKPPVAFGPDKALLWKTSLPSGVSSPCIWGLTRVALSTGGGVKSEFLSVLFL